MTIKRLHDSPERLADFIESRRHMPFAWGTNDCALFYADAILAQTGVDLAARWRGYSAQRGAMSRVKKAGGMLALAITAGLREKPIGFAQRGDGVIVELEGRETFGLVKGDGFWCGPGATGLVFRPVRNDRIHVAIGI